MIAPLLQERAYTRSADRAVTAWAKLAPFTADAGAVDALQEKEFSAVYRLRGAGPAAENVIAKWLRTQPWSVEKTAYEDVLPQVDPDGLRYFGSVMDDAEGFRWLFVQEAEGIEYNALNPAHRALAADWLAGMHSRSLVKKSFGSLPELNIPGQAEQAEQSRQRIESQLAHPALCDDDRAVLHEVMEQCRRFVQWCDGFDRYCARFPRTLVHGDFVAKNLRLRHRPNDAPTLLVFDWETARHGPPAADLAECEDLDAYTDALKGPMRSASRRDVQMLALIGKALRWATAVDWASLSLSCHWVARPMRRFRCYRQNLLELAGSLEQAGM